MKTIGRTCAAFVLIGMVGAGIHLLGDQTFVGPALTFAAQPWHSDPHTCSQETLEGTYGTSSFGSIVSGGPVGQVAEAGTITFDGDGGVTQTTTVSLNGMIIPNRPSLSGSYMVNADCTGDISLTIPTPTCPSPSDLHFAIVDDGNELKIVNSGAGRVLLGDAKRQHTRRW